MPKKEDLVGKRFGKLTVLYEDTPLIDFKNRQSIRWVCQCDCGNVVSVRSSNLLCGIANSCGCIKHPDLTGKRFGKLVAIRRTETKDGYRYWLCKCDCGSEVNVRATQLTQGRTNSCGCLRKESKRFQDLKGTKFGKLTVLERVGTKINSPYWKCKCDCGNVIFASSNVLINGKNNCGCIPVIHGTHNLSDTRLYRIYSGMKARCYNKKATHYIDYGSRGITVCKEWLDDFMNFYNWAMTHGYSDDLTIDRIDVNGNYCPENCRWTDIGTQQNNKRTNVIIEYNGKSQTLSEWAKEMKMNPDTLRDRINKLGWDIEKAFTTPVKKQNR